MGDFNAVVDKSERKKEAKTTVNKSKAFKACLEKCSLMDLAFSGPKYTWARGRDSRTLKMARLDRAICNADWRVRFDRARVVHLPRRKSDHCPILLTTGGRVFINTLADLLSSFKGYSSHSEALLSE